MIFQHIGIFFFFNKISLTVEFSVNKLGEDLQLRSLAHFVIFKYPCLLKHDKVLLIIVVVSFLIVPISNVLDVVPYHISKTIQKILPRHSSTFLSFNYKRYIIYTYYIFSCCASIGCTRCNSL